MFPVAPALLYLGFTKQLLLRETWRRLHPFRGVLIALAIAALVILPDTELFRIAATS